MAISVFRIIFLITLQIAHIFRNALKAPIGGLQGRLFGGSLRVGKLGYAGIGPQ